jgi:hypothetical protein
MVSYGNPMGVSAIRGNEALMDLRVFWGKTGTERGSHPAVCHMLDVGAGSRTHRRIGS